MIRSLFERYQPFLLAFANTGFGRLYLEAKPGRIYKVTPDSLHYIDRGVARADFFPRSPYLRKFRVALESIAIVEREGIMIREWLARSEYVIPHFAGLHHASWLPLIALATANFNPDASPETTCVDGDVLASGTVWATIRGASTGSANDSGTGFGVYAQLSGSTYSCRRLFSLFDTSSLGLYDVITAATFRLISDQNNAGGGYTGGLVQSTPASNTAIVADDYDQCGALNSPTEGATRVNIQDGAASGTSYTWTLDATGRGWIDKNGITKLGVRHQWDIDNTTPTVDFSGRPTFSTAENGSNIPLLQVTYTPASFVPRAVVF